jgi:hypothetical protein
MGIMDEKRGEVLDDGRGTRFGREVQTNRGPVVGVPEDVKKGDRIVFKYRSTASCGLNFFIRKIGVKSKGVNKKTEQAVTNAIDFLASLGYTGGDIVDDLKEVLK